MSTPAPGLANEQALREQMLAAALQLDAVGLNRGSTGNLSVRVGDQWLVTPSGIAAQDLGPQSMVQMDFNGEPSGPGKPSSEWRFHRDILASRTDVGAIVHTHSRFATAFACLHREIPAFHYMIAIAGETAYVVRRMPCSARRNCPTMHSKPCRTAKLVCWATTV